MESIREFTSKDGDTYILTVRENVIRLSDSQLDELERKISTLTSEQITDGVDLFLGDTTQQKTVLDLIQEILGEFNVQEIIDLKLVDTTKHAKVDRMSDKHICIERDWSHDKVEEEIVECLKDSYDVQQVRVRFNSARMSWKTFGFKVTGIVGTTPKDIVVYFEEDPVDASQTIVVITILG